MTGVIPVRIYLTYKPYIVACIVNQLKEDFYSNDDEPGSDKFLSAKEQCPNMKNIVTSGQYNKAKNADHGDMMIIWPYFLAFRDGVPGEDLETRMDIPKITSVYKLLYISDINTYRISLARRRSS